MKVQIAEELNVVKLEDISTAQGDLVNVRVKANFRTLGAKYGSSVQEIAQAIGVLNAAELVSAVRREGQYLVVTASGTWKIEIDDLVITEEPSRKEPKTGWTVVSHESESVAIDLALTPDLIESGQVREVIRFLQESRKVNGFEISDRINVQWNAPEDVASAVAKNLAFIQGEVLALAMERNVDLGTAEGELGFVAQLKKSS
ncbi:MAG: DUF5915 domain-containing protein [Actinomycetota bacterium]